MQSFGSKRRTVRGNGARCRTGRAHDTRTARGHRRPGRNHHHCARGRAGPRVSRYRLGHARCVRRCGRPSALVETRHAARDGHPCHRRTRADACPDGLGAHDVRRPYEADFADLASGAFKGRSSATQRAMFNFSGHALADLAVAQGRLRDSVAERLTPASPRTPSCTPPAASRPRSAWRCRSTRACRRRRGGL